MNNSSILGNSEKEKERIAEFLEATFSAMNESMTIYDSDLCLVAWNKQYEELGLMPSEFIHYGASLPSAYLTLAKAGAFGPGDPEALVELHISSVRDGPLIENEILLTPDGRQIRIRRFALKNGGVCATLLDVTEEINMQEQLRQSTKLDALGQFTGGFAHDMNNVLATVMGCIDLEKSKLNRKSPFLDSALESAQRGVDLTQQLLAFARKQELSPEIFLPGKLLDNMATMLRPLLGESIAIKLELDVGLWKIKADKLQLESVLVNLAINARDAMPDGGELTFKVCNTSVDEENDLLDEIGADHYVCISAIDVGMGMDQQTVSNAFEPFFTTKGKGTGTGLGLSMAHGFVKQSNGHIMIYSELRQGTTVKIYLPRA